MAQAQLVETGHLTQSNLQYLHIYIQNFRALYIAMSIIEQVGNLT